MRMIFLAAIGFMGKRLSRGYRYAHLVYNRTCRVDRDILFTFRKFFKPELERFARHGARFLKISAECDASGEIGERDVIAAFFGRVKNCKI